MSLKKNLFQMANIGELRDEFKDVAISSRIRLARNVSGFNFFTKLTSEIDAEFILNTMEKILNDFGNFDFSKCLFCS